MKKADSLPHMSIREGQETDLSDVAALHVANQRTTYRGLLSDDYLDGLDPVKQAQKWAVFSRQEGQKLFIARAQSGILGFAACRKDDELPGCLYLESLHVAPEARGRGVGTALIRRVAHYAREIGFRSMSVCIVKGNEGAGRLYARTGAVHRKDFTDHFEGTISHSEKLLWQELPLTEKESL